MDDEELVEPRRLPRRASRTGALAAVVLVAVAALVWILTRTDDPSRPVAAPTSATPPPVTPPPVTPPPVTSPPRPPCLDVGSSTSNCGITSRLPPAVLTAVRTVLPRARVVAASTVTGRDGRVVSRRASFRSAAGGASAELVVSPRRTGPGTRLILVGLVAGHGRVSAGSDDGRVHVELTVRAPTGRPLPSLPEVQRLATDQRLLAVR